MKHTASGNRTEGGRSEFSYETPYFTHPKTGGLAMRLNVGLALRR